MNADLGLYAQDRWTIKRLTLNFGLRFDYFNGSVPAAERGELLARFGLYSPPLVPVRSYPEVKDVPNWKDLNPRMAAVYDLFGNGKTAVRASLGRYVAGETVDDRRPRTTRSHVRDERHPDLDRHRTATSSWTATSTNPLANGECGPLSNRELRPGESRTRRGMPTNVLRGYGKRGYNWEGVAGIQHELRAGRVGHAELLPALVRQLHRHAEYRHRGQRLQPVLHHGPGRFPAAGRRRQSDVRLLRRQPEQVRPGAQPGLPGVGLSASRSRCGTGTV